MIKKITYIMTIFLMTNSVPVMAADGSGVQAFFANIGEKISDGIHNNAAKKVDQANAAKDYSGEVTFMNNQLKLDKAFTKRYNQLQPKESGNCYVEYTEQECPNIFKYKEDSDEVAKSKKEIQQSLQEYEDKMMRARTLSELGSIYFCAKTSFAKCHYIGGASGTTKTFNGTARFINKAAEFFNRDAPIDDDWDIRDVFSDQNKDVSEDAACKSSEEVASDTMNEYLGKLKNCEHIEQVTLSGYTDEDIKQLQEKYEAARDKAQSKANRMLTGLSMAATGVGGMELAQGLAEQKADKAAEQAMSAYISTMRCSYGNGKSVKAGTEEIELPGGNNANMMKYRTEYTTLAADLKERKNALDMTPGIESEEILDKSQMGLYDDENVGITGGRYASLYRAQMLGSESDQAQLDSAKQTSKTRVIGGAVAAGAGVVGGIVGDELINQSLSSSTKTAQTCTESGGTWQGARCHCPDGFIQRTKTGPCFEEQPTETAENPTPSQGNYTPSQSGTPAQPTGEYEDDPTDNVNDPNSDNDVDENIGPEYTKTGVNNVDLFNEDENQDIATKIGRDILNNPSKSASTDLANESNTNDYTMINGAPVAKKLDLQTPNTDLAIATGAGVGAVVASTTGSAPQSNSTQSNSTKDNNVNNNSKISDNGGTATPQANDSTKTLSATKTNKSDSPDTNISSATKSEKPKADEAQSNTSDTKETEQKKVKERPSQNSSKSIPPRANTTNNKTQTSKQSSSNGKKDLKYIYGTFEDAQVTKSQAEQLVKLWAEHTGIKGLTCDKEIRGNIELVCSNSNTDYHFIFEDLTESFSRTQKKSIAMTVCKIFGGKKQTDLDTGLASRIHCEINTNVCNNQLNSALKRFGQKSYMYNVYSSTGNGATKTLSRTYCTIEW